jgi:RNA polymerase sigma factor (sigma-70 family)
MRDQQYRRYAAAIDRFLLCTFGTAFSTHDREELRQDAFAGLETARARGGAIRNEEALLITCAANAAKSRLRSNDRYKRHSFDPLDSLEARLPDRSVSPDVAVIEADENRRVAMLIEQLDDPRARDVLKLRLELDLEWSEIARYLGLGKSQTYLLLRKAGNALWELLVNNASGKDSEQQRELLLACVMGVASPEQRRRAEQLRDDPHARALLAELRDVGRQVAAVLPLPSIVATDAPGGRLSQVIAHFKDQLADAGEAIRHQTVTLVGRTPGQNAASQIAAAGGGRGSGPAVVAVVACLGASGGAAVGINECLEHEVPTRLVDAIPGVGHDDRHPNSPAAVPPDVTHAVPVLPDSPPAAVPPDTESNARPTNEPAPVPPSTGDSVSGLSGAPASTPAPAPPSPPPASSSSGTSGTTFGGL